jgi:hypothetical protein
MKNDPDHYPNETIMTKKNDKLTAGDELFGVSE